MYQAWVIASRSVAVFVRSFLLWSFRDWRAFWLAMAPRTRVLLRAIPLWIRTDTLAEKIVDLYMAVYCIVEEEYHPAGFRLAATDTVVDIGGHIGTFTVPAARAVPRGRVVVCEPDPENRDVLLANIAENKLSNVLVLPVAVTGAAGERLLYRDGWNSAKHSLTRGTGDAVRVPTLSLTEVFLHAGIERCQFLKMDCEGGEYEILLAASRDLLARIDRIALELHTPASFGIVGEHYTKERIIRHLTAAGFRVRVVPENQMHDLVFATRIPAA